MLSLHDYLICVFMFGNVMLAQERKISGRVQSEGFPLREIEVINSRNKTTVKTDKAGTFTILAKSNDELIIYGADYPARKIILKEKDFSTDALTIELKRKTIELKEVEVKKEAALHVDVSYNSLKTVEIEKEQSRPQPLGVYTGEIVNGIDFVKVGEKFLVLFKDGSEKTRKKEDVAAFKNYIERHFSTAFFVNKLHLNEKEIPFFIDFCSKDFASAQIPKNNQLDVIEFLIAKREEYKK